MYELNSEIKISFIFSLTCPHPSSHWVVFYQILHLNCIQNQVLIHHMTVIGIRVNNYTVHWYFSYAHYVQHSHNSWSLLSRIVLLHCLLWQGIESVRKIIPKKKTINFSEWKDDFQQQSIYSPSSILNIPSFFSSFVTSIYLLPMHSHAKMVNSRIIFHRNTSTGECGIILRTFLLSLKTFIHL